MIDKLINKLGFKEEAVVANKALFWSCFNRDLSVFSVHIKPSKRDAIYEAMSVFCHQEQKLLDVPLMTTYTALQHIIDLFNESRIDPRHTETYALLLDDLNAKKKIYYEFYSSTSVATYLYLHPALSNSGSVIITKDWEVNNEALSSYIDNLIDDYAWLATKNRTLPLITDAALDDKLLRTLDPVFSLGGCIELSAQIANPFGGNNGERVIYRWLNNYFQGEITKSWLQDFILERIVNEQRYFKETLKQTQISEPDYRVTKPVINKSHFKAYKPEDPRQYFHFMAKTKREPQNQLETMLDSLGIQQYYSKPLGLSHPELLGNVNIIGCTGSGSTTLISALMDNVLRTVNGAIITFSVSTPIDISAYELLSKVTAVGRIGDVVMCDINQAMNLDFEDLVKENKIVLVLNHCTPNVRANHEDIDRYVKFLDMLSEVDCYFDNVQHFHLDMSGLTSTERFLYTADKPIRHLNAKGLGIINTMAYFNEHDCGVRGLPDIAKMISLFRTQALMRVETPPDWLCHAQGGYVAHRCKQLHPGEAMLFVNGELVHEGRMVYHESDVNMLNPYIPYTKI